MITKDSWSAVLLNVNNLDNSLDDGCKLRIYSNTILHYCDSNLRGFHNELSARSILLSF